MTQVCADTNSSPDTPRESCEFVPPGAPPLNTFEALLSSRPGMSSVWGAYHDRAGGANGAAGPSPVTTNKMRGPLSAQPQKIGEHAYALVDQVREK